MNGDPAGTFVVWTDDLDKVPLKDTRGRPITGKVKEIKRGNKAAIVIMETADV